MHAILTFTMSPMTYEVKTRVFEGPLDLLLQLITSHEVEITELSLSDLVGEYLDHLELMRDLDLAVTSEFLLIASTLIQLKARHLLPDDRFIDLDDELALAGERDRLLARLLMNLTFKDVAAVIAHRIEAEERYTGRSIGLEGITAPPPALVLPVDPTGLAVIAERVFSGVYEEPDTDHLALELPSIQDAILDLQDRMESAVSTDFEDLVAHCTDSYQVVAYFLGLLELARWGMVRVSQEDRFAPIVVDYNEAGASFDALIRGEDPP
jgi:segregation and condensation protein A